MNIKITNIVKIAFEAGEIMKDFFYKKNFIKSKKDDSSDVTSADLKISEFIYSKLSNLSPNIPIICEERKKTKITSDIFFLIDPIDGTSSFIKGRNEFSVNIALIKNNKPIFGLIYAPIFQGGKLAYNDFDNNVFLYKNIIENAANIDQFLKEDALSILKNPKNNNIKKIITSRRADDNQINKLIKQDLKLTDHDFEITKLSSAAKFFYLIEQNYDYYIHLNPTMSWDIAAGQAIIEQLNYKVNILQLNNNDHIAKKYLSYNNRDYFNPPFIIRKNG